MWPRGGRLRLERQRAGGLAAAARRQLRASLALESGLSALVVPGAARLGSTMPPM